MNENLEIMGNTNGGLLTPQQAADYLQVRLSTIYQMSMRGSLSKVKIGKLVRFRRTDLDAFISQNLQGMR
ncbi:MAG: helix-turn-helix domain-containing protein [Candidatus Kuenenia sp.]|nr:helix-turn-helix domain-containing protein [Candidatus Kuenenia hertensis]